jgi:hypothetical protein
MLDLKNLGGGKKLIQKIIRNNVTKDMPWSKSKQYQQLKNTKNNRNPKIK